MVLFKVWTTLGSILEKLRKKFTGDVELETLFFRIDPSELIETIRDEVRRVSVLPRWYSQGKFLILLENCQIGEGKLMPVITLDCFLKFGRIKPLADIERRGLDTDSSRRCDEKCKAVRTDVGGF